MLSLRIPEELELKLIELCKEENKTKTKIIQESLLLYIDLKQQKASAYELGKKYFGKYKSGNSNKSKDHKTIIRQKIKQKQNG